MRKRVILYVTAVVALATVVLAQTASPIPPYYFANYAITNQWDQILSMFTTIDAAKNTGTDLDEVFFGDLHDYFEDVFPYLPQDEDFAVTYEQCRITSNNLAIDYTYNGFELFLNGCYNPLNRAINRMNSQYSVKPSVQINPSSGAAPLSVTFDARNSTDPSNDTIPSSNFFRYYKDTNGDDQIIGQGPVVNHVFTSEGQYQVHLTVRSVNQPTEGILDGAQTVSVDVTPQSALVRVFANGKQLDENNHTKIGTAEAQRGILLDASATVPTGGRTIEEHTWNVQQGSQTIYARTEPGRPGVTSVQFPAEGQFTVSLTVVDNQGNTLTETYRIVVSDPLAIIKTSPDQGDTSTKFTFDGGASYSLVSSIKLYTREIFDSDNQRINTFQGRSIAKQFTQPGSYTIKLTVEDEQARVNSDTIQLYVESTEPEAQFRMTPAQEWAYPSQFIFDAGLSSDIDIINADDSLLYSWRFTPEQSVSVDQIIDNGRQVIASFNTPGEYQAKLTVQDSYGKMSEIIKDITIESAMRPTIFMVPKATTWGVPVTMVARSNITPLSYEWDFGDGTRGSSTTSPKVTHTYEEVGVYVVKLTVYGPDNQENTVIDTVFIGEKDSPIPQFKVLNRQNTIMKQVTSCNDQPAYLVDRRENITINASESVNTQGVTSNIDVYMQPQGDDIFQRGTIQYRFQEIGCQYVDLTVRDNDNNKTATTRIWFSVVNALPTIQNIQLNFPQYGGGSSYGIGPISLNSTDNAPRASDVFSPNVYDPLVVHVTAQGVTDPDGIISYYKRYYYKKDNPSRYLETKITPASVAEVYFSLPRQGGEYEFGVTMVDNDGGESHSTDLLGGGRTVFFPPDTTNSDIPMVTLKQSQTIVKAGDEVTFDVSSQIISDKPDFVTNRVIKYDFDGDGTYDLTTKDDQVTHIYRETGTVTPKVAVIYRDNKGYDFGEDITIEQNIKPLMYITQHGPYILARDISVGSIIESYVCVDARACAADSSLVFDLGQDANSSQKTIVYRYPASGKYFVDIQVKDDLGQEASRKYPLTIVATGAVDFFYPLTIPEAQEQGNGYVITVGNQLDNTVSYLLQYAGSGICYMDLNIIEDTNNDGIGDNDADIDCNTLVSITYDDARHASRATRVYYQQEGVEVKRDITINFVDIKNTLTPEQQVIYTKLGTIIGQLPNETEQDRYVRGLLVSLQASLDDRDVRGGLILDIEMALVGGGLTIADAQSNQIQAILMSMKGDSLIAASGGTPYDQAKAEIMLLAGDTLGAQLTPYFAAIESGEVSTPDDIRTQLQTILNTLIATVDQEGGIDDTDVNLVLMPNICRIMEYYEITSETCQSYAVSNGLIVDTPAIPEDEMGSNTGTGRMSGIVRRVLIIVGVLLLAFGGLVGFFVLKAKRAQAGQAE